MPLRDLSPGEILDRLTILTFKLEAAREADRLPHASIQAWEEEEQALNAIFRERFPLYSAAIVGIGLAVINAQIWEMEAATRRGDDIPHRQVQMLNDCRMATIKTINQYLGAQTAALEKL